MSWLFYGGLVVGLGLVGYTLYNTKRKCKQCGRNFFMSKTNKDHVKGFCCVFCREVSEEQS